MEPKPFTLPIFNSMLGFEHFYPEIKSILISSAFAICIGAGVHGLARLLFALEVKDKGIIEALYEIKSLIMYLTDTNRIMLSWIPYVLGVY
jgi:hypothetical protein